MVTDQARASARDQAVAAMAVAEDRHDRVMAADAAIVLGDVDRAVRRGLGVPHAYASHAPRSVATLGDACEAMTAALAEWDSPCSAAVIRTAITGYDVWIGIGGRMRRVGRASSIATAEVTAVAAVLAHRRAAMAEVRRILRGWAPATPYYGATLGTAADVLSVQIRRGPMTGRDMPGAGQYGASSWDLPVVAVWRDGEIAERYPERVTWDDDAVRAAARERQRRGEAARAARDLAARA